MTNSQLSHIVDLVTADTTKRTMDTYKPVTLEYLRDHLKRADTIDDQSDHRDLIDFAIRWYSATAYKIILEYGAEYNDSSYDVQPTCINVFDKDNKSLPVIYPAKESAVDRWTDQYEDEWYRIRRDHQKEEISDHDDAMDYEDTVVIYIGAALVELPTLYIKS